MVNFVPPADYIYGTRDFDTACQQGGAYNRDFVGVRVERCAAGAIDTMHAYFEALDLRSRVVQQAALPNEPLRPAAGRKCHPHCWR